ncbi:hypothetical protein J6E39_02645 [bacterium]|nr:hypothetical protein [bacterium]
MKCFNHHDRDAFGICKSCGKALCLECMTIENGKVLCKDSEACHKGCGCHKHNHNNGQLAKSLNIGYYAGVLFAVVGAIGLVSSAFDFEFGRAFFAIVALLIGLNLIKGY